jgi:hypothetical protein
MGGRKPVLTNKGRRPAVPGQLHPQVRQLLDEIERFLDDHEMSRTMFGKLAANDGKLVPRLEQYSRATTLQTIDKVRDFMQNYVATPE